MPDQGLYIQLFSIHGLVRGESPELGSDADTGGQVKYVLELARALAEQPEIAQVDLVTRLINDRSVSDSYSQTIEILSEKSRIVRIQCGGKKYIRKELLWPHLDEFVDKTLKFLKLQGLVPDIFHGHYADGGYIASELATIFSAPFIFTGHSMGLSKKDKLLNEGLSAEEINRRYKIDHRINVEETIIKEAELIITSTRHEIDKQYSLYKNSAAARFKIIPPGIDIESFYPYYNIKLNPLYEEEQYKQARIALLHELHRFWVNPLKPFILVLCRPDGRKNISGLIKAYAENKDLQAIANLAIFAGIRKDIADMEENERNVLTEMLLLMDMYDLYGKMAIPKKHDFTTEVPELYRLCADSRGIFVNPALVEPFGLTLIEAASCGLPIVATREGGPADIIKNCNNGILVDPTRPEEIAAAIKNLLVDKELWETCSQNGINGVRLYYAWDSHCRSTVDVYNKAMADKPETDKQKGRDRPWVIGRRLSNIKKLLITDIDNTLIGDGKGLKALLKLLAGHQEYIGWGVATGRCLNLALEALEENNIPVPDVLICSVGSEIYYGSGLTVDKGWQQHISNQWKPDMLREELATFDFLELQEKENQRRYKISYYLEEKPQRLDRIHAALKARKLRYHLIYSHGQFLDILPYRASKGKAIRYLSYKWDLPLNDILVSGDSGNDEDMLRGNTCGVVVGNYNKELEHLQGKRRVYFSEYNYAEAIIDGIYHYGFLTR